MPANDKYQNAVVHALQKLNYTISQEQKMLRYGRRRVLIDMSARSDAEPFNIYVEVKGFELVASYIDYFYSVIGQYVTYRAIIQYEIDVYPLYLAVPQAAYEGFLSEPLCQMLIEQLQILFIVFDPVSEEVLYVRH